jgi:hypothetical protein
MRLVAGAKDTVRIARTIAPVPVTRAERDSVIATFEQKGPSGLDFSRIPRTKPAIERITVDDQGRPWVRRTNAQGVVAFDIYGSSGQPVATAELGAYRSPAYLPFVVRGDDVYMVVSMRTTFSTSCASESSAVSHPEHGIRRHVPYDDGSAVSGVAARRKQVQCRTVRAVSAARLPLINGVAVDGNEGR